MQLVDSVYLKILQGLQQRKASDSTQILQIDDSDTSGMFSCSFEEMLNWSCGVAVFRSRRPEEMKSSSTPTRFFFGFWMFLA